MSDAPVPAGQGERARLAPQTIASTHPFEGRFVSVRVDEVRLEDGTVIRQEVVDHAGSVTMVPFADERTVILIRQYRHPTGQVLLETPAGSIDPGETPDRAAVRELEEEIGFRPRRLVPVGAFFLAPGWATEYMHVFLAFDLEVARAEADADERIEVVQMPLEEAWRLLDEGEIRDCKSIAALALARAFLAEKRAAPPA